MLAPTAALLAGPLVSVRRFFSGLALFGHVAAAASSAVRMVMVRLLGLKGTGNFFFDLAHSVLLCTGDDNRRMQCPTTEL